MPTLVCHHYPPLYLTMMAFMIDWALLSICCILYMNFSGKALIHFSYNKVLVLLLSGSLMSRTNSFSNNHHQTPIGRSNNTSDVGIIDQAMMSVGRGNPPYGGSSNSGFDTRPNHASPSSGVDDEARVWLLNLLMQQSTPANQDLEHPHTYMQQAPAAYQAPRYVGQIGDRCSWNDMFQQTGQIQQSTNTSSYTPSQQEPDHGMYSNSYQPAVDGMRLRNEPGMAEVMSNERSGFNRYCSGYGDHIFQPSSGDRYPRVFGM